MEQSLLVIKPDAVKEGHIGEIITMVERSGLKITGLLLRHLTRTEAERFYSVHQRKEFFEGLVEFITSGPVVAVRVAGENARERLRQLVGATDPQKAEKGTIRERFGSSARMNAVHASNPEEDVSRELAFFFKNEREEAI